MDSAIHKNMLSVFFETDITIREAALGRPIPDNARPKCIQDLDPEELEILERLEMATIISEEYERATDVKHEGVPDQRAPWISNSH